MMSIRALKIWGFTAIAGSILQTILIAGWLDAKVDSSTFPVVLFFGTVFSFPAIPFMWAALHIIKKMPSNFDRVLVLFFSVVLADIAVFTIFELVLGLKAFTSMSDAVSYIAGFLIVSVPTAFVFARDIVWQPYPEYLDDMREMKMQQKLAKLPYNNEIRR